MEEIIKDVVKDMDKKMKIKLSLEGWSFTVAILGICGTCAYTKWLDYKKIQ